MRKVEEFYECSTAETDYKIAVEVVGRQSNDMWIMSKETHLSADGIAIAIKDSPYCWVTAPGLPPLDHQCNVKPGTTIEAILAIKELVAASKHVYRQNFPAALLMMGAQMMCMHYEHIHELAGQVPVSLAFGPVSLGKSLAATAAQSIIGLSGKYRMAKISDRQALRIASKSTLGFLLDDPSSPSEFAEKVLLHFEKGIQTSCSATYQPRCTFMATLNLNCIEAFAAMPKR